MSGDLIALAQAVLGPDVIVVGGRIAALQDALWPQEAALMQRASAIRLADFTAGRTAVRQALIALGLPSQPILQGPGGEPDWPKGITGSLTHGGQMCLAALGRTNKMLSLGVDLEPILPLDPDVVSEICTPSEQRWIAIQPDPTDLPLRIFTAKEATYKALYPLTGVVLDFAALTIDLTPKRDAFTARLTRNIRPFNAGTGFRGQQVVAQNTVLSILKIPITPL